MIAMKKERKKLSAAIDRRCGACCDRVLIGVVCCTNWSCRSGSIWRRRGERFGWGLIVRFRVIVFELDLGGVVGECVYGSVEVPGNL